MCNIQTIVFFDTLEQAAVYLEAGGDYMSAERLRLIADAIFSRPDIFKLLQEAMADILVEKVRKPRKGQDGNP